MDKYSVVYHTMEYYTAVIMKKLQIMEEIHKCKKKARHKKLEYILYKCVNIVWKEAKNTNTMVLEIRMVLWGKGIR